MRNTFVLFKRELAGYFATPVAYVFICIFLLMCGILTFYLGDFFPEDPTRGQATLGPSFFQYHPILYIVLIPRSRCACGPRSASRARSSS
jgi:ABC-2 type transport system permease protein